MEISESVLNDLLRWRKEQNDYLKTDIDRLIPEHKGSEITELQYFSPDSKYRFKVRLHRYQDPELVTMTDKKGSRKMNYRRFGYFDVMVGGKRTVVHAYVSAEEGEDNQKLFIPFRDLTSGKESYEGARYLELDMKHVTDDEYDLDFNFAYNPNCAYSDSWACMMPPKENWLDVEIRAGERKYLH